jgi:DNA-binding MarR family transcriptional regulator
MVQTPQSRSTTAQAARLRLALARTARRLRQQAGTGLSPSLSAALATVERHGPVTPSELAELERVQRPTATRIVARLEQEALIERTADPRDARSALVSVTPGGRAALREMRTRKDAWLARRLHELDAEERATLERAAVLLERILEDGRP